MKLLVSMRFLSAVALYCLMLGSSVAQDLKLPRIWERFDGTDCETTKAELDLIAVTAGRDKTVIIIAHLGDGEGSRGLNRRRLEVLRYYLKNTRGLAKSKVVVAEGERVRGLGRVNIYVGGELFTIFTVKRNKDLAQGCSTA